MITSIDQLAKLIGNAAKSSLKSLINQDYLHIYRCHHPAPNSPSLAFITIIKSTAIITATTATIIITIIIVVVFVINIIIVVIIIILILVFFLSVTHIYCQECNCKHFKVITSLLPLLNPNSCTIILQVTIPKKHTTYWCSLIKAPKITSKHHITKV